jgi:hypothetical protein
MIRETVINTQLAVVEIVEHSRDCDNYSIEIEYSYSDGTSVISLTRDGLRDLGQSLIDFANEREQ